MSGEGNDGVIDKRKEYLQEEKLRKLPGETDKV